MSLEDLKVRSIIKKYGLDTTARFRVTIPLPDAVNEFIEQQQEQNGGLLPEWAQSALRIGSIALGGGSYNDRGLQFMCVGAPLPATQLATEESPVNGHTLHVATGVERDLVTFRFLVSSDFYEKTLFDKWLNFTVDEITRKAAYYDSYVTDITIEGLDKQDSSVYTLNMIDTYPVQVDTYEFDRQASDQYGILSVSFRTEYVTDEELPRDESSGLPGNIGGLVDGLTSGNLEQAAYSARQLAIQAKNGQFTGEAAALYGKINEIVDQSVGFSATEVDKMIGNLGNMVNLSSISDTDKGSLLDMLGLGG